MKRRTASWLAVVSTLVLALGLSACSSATSRKGTATTTSISNPGPAQNVSADRALASAANLKLSDFPTGWTSNPSQNSVSANDKQLGDQLASCLHVGLGFFNANDPASVDSPEFDDSNGSTAQSSVDYQVSAARVQTMMGVVQGSKFPPCMTSALRGLVNSEIQHPSNPSDTLPAGATIGTVTFAPMSFPSYGDRSSAFRVTIPISFNGLTLSGYFDLIVVQKARAVISLQFFGNESPFDASMEQQLTGAVVGRVAST